MSHSNVYIIFCTVVPEYEVIAPYKSDDSGSFVDYVHHDEERTRRATSEPNVWYFKIEAFGRSLHLNVTKVMPKITAGAVVETVDHSGKSTYKEVPRGVHYTGHVTSEPESLVAISGNKGLVSLESGSCASVDVKVCKTSTLILKQLSYFVSISMHDRAHNFFTKYLISGVLPGSFELFQSGIIQTLQDTLYIRPLSQNLVEKNQLQHGLPHIIYRRSINQDLNPDFHISSKKFNLLIAVVIVHLRHNDINFFLWTPSMQSEIFKTWTKRYDIKMWFYSLKKPRNDIVAVIRILKLFSKEPKTLI